MVKYGRTVSGKYQSEFKGFESEFNNTGLLILPYLG